MQQSIAINAIRPCAMCEQQDAAIVRTNSAVVDFSRAQPDSFPRWMTSGG